MLFDKGQKQTSFAQNHFYTTLRKCLNLALDNGSSRLCVIDLIKSSELAWKRKKRN